MLLTRGCARVSLAVLSMYDGSHAYGKATLRGMFARLLRGFPTGVPLYPVVPTGSTRGGSRSGDGATIRRPTPSRVCASDDAATAQRSATSALEPRLDPPTAAPAGTRCSPAR